MGLAVAVDSWRFFVRFTVMWRLMAPRIFWFGFSLSWSFVCCFSLYVLWLLCFEVFMVFVVL